MLPLLWQRFFSGKNDKPYAPSPFLFSEMVNRDVKKPTHFSQGVGNVAPGVALQPCNCIHRLSFKPVLVSTRFLQTRFYARSLSYRLPSISKKGLFEEFYKFPEMEGMISILETNLKIAEINIYACDFVHIIWLCERPITFVRLVNVWVLDVLYEIYKNICGFFSTFCKPTF